MRRPPRVRVSTLRATLTLLAACAAACSSGNPEAGSADAPIGIQILQTYVTVENRTGAPLVGGEIDIIPAGVLPPFKAALPRLEAGAKRDIPFNTFRGGGTSFNRTIARAKSVKVTAKDQFDKVYEHEVPFN
ncbi:MAG: hypothetical protein HYX77_00205 [Acidobacteria bacterium]|nr:hypothetical protein [Acidobacteriota bacterium]